MNYNQELLIIIPIHLILVYFIYNFNIEAYKRNHSTEIIGDYCEKNEYKTQYFVDIYDDDNPSYTFLKLVADIHVYSENWEGESSEDRYGNLFTETNSSKKIKLLKIYHPVYGELKFDYCFLETEKEVDCEDNNGKIWKIELTNKKVKPI